MSRKPEDLPVESLFRCFGHKHPGGGRAQIVCRRAACRKGPASSLAPNRQEGWLHGSAPSRNLSRLDATPSRDLRSFVALATEVRVADELKRSFILVIPRSRNSPRPNQGLTMMGADRNAIRAFDRADRLHDLGINSESAAFCVRTSAPSLESEFAGRVGQGWANCRRNWRS